MRHRPRRIGALTAAAAAIMLGGASDPGGSVALKITGLRSTKGQVLVCLTREPKHFPDCSGSADARTAKVPASKPETHFAGLAEGRYAVSVLHDENGNDRADKTLGMIPKEGFGFSRDAPVRMGPPRFDQAAFALDGSDVTQSIRMRYLF